MEYRPRPELFVDHAVRLRLTAMETEPRWRYIAPICIACAVGCRPFQAVYVPAVLIALYRARRKEMDGPAWRCALQCLPYVIVPGLIACAYGIYNFVRFGNIFEFGHNYLPEFTRAQEGQFSATYISGNWENINRMPYVDEDGRLNFPHSFGFAFYLANPLYLVAAIPSGGMGNPPVVPQAAAQLGRDGQRACIGRNCSLFASALP